MTSLADGTGRFEVTFGDAAQWAPTSPDRPRLQQQARLSLASLMLDDATAFAQSRARMDRAIATDTTGFFRIPKRQPSKS